MTTTPRALKAALALALASSALGAAATTTMYRCGPDGRTWSQTPCTDGQQVQIRAAVPTERVEQAREVAQRERALADHLHQERVHREAHMRKTARGAAGFHTAPRAEPPKRPVAASPDTPHRKDKPSRPKGSGSTPRSSTPAPAPSPSINAR